jgi:hypothetical protein
MAISEERAVAVRDEQRDISSIDLTAIERVIVKGDLSQLNPDERWDYYQGVCRSIGLNPFTQPFAYLKLTNGLTLYALKGAAEQLRRIYGVSIAPPTVAFSDGLVVVTVTATDSTGRADSDLGLVNIENLKGEARANAVMKAITKAKRRVTLSMCGLGMLDETEVDTIPNARRVAIEDAHAQPKPAATMVDLAWRYESDGHRDEAEAEYARLAMLAVELGHKQAQKIRQKAVADLKDGELAASVAALQRWEREQKPATVDATNAGDDD